ncbi:hypothetical protein DFH08DRAFT_347807 [Mycena albidolilacea]|uniref:Uncharacterized protein n=1 Tax=Mycena albidolilacea TaxID=1033008 RepID=A0AAD6ZJT0_9AGAR|nr:hypothetical protein DFH08DRAFT_347807 [Mycena albidolilacea]
MCMLPRSESLTMQLPNGISNPVGLWLGHLLFDSIPRFIMATLVVILFTILPNQFYWLGLLFSFTSPDIFLRTNPENTNGIIKTMHFSLSLFSPIASVTRAGTISVSCGGGDSEHVSSSAMIGINEYGGHVLNLVLQSIALFTLYCSGSTGVRVSFKS